MDNLCHTLVGAALGEAGLKRRTGLAMATLMIGANLPDLDVLAIPFGESLTFRRGWTHGPLAWVVLPVALTALMLAWDRVRLGRGADRPPVRPAQLLLLAVVGVLSHPFFDWLNSYGIRLLMPFSEEWFYGDAIFIIDPWIWLALGAGVALSRRRARRAHPAAAAPARVAVAGVALYVAAMVAGSAAAQRMAVREIEARGAGRVERLMAQPVPLDPLRREVVYQAGDAYGFGVLRWTPAPRLSLQADRVRIQGDHPAARAARGVESVADFLYWARFPYFVVEPEGAGAWVRAGDARYLSGPRGGWFSERVWVANPRAP